MTATDELRRLLDERGVEWREHTELQGEITLWNGWQFFEGMASYNDGYSMLSMVDATPEQAVDATLGSGENAKLRELCADLYDYAAFSIDYFGDAHGILPRMRELGIEVDA